MKRQQIIAIVVVLVLAGAAGAGYQFYFRPQLEKFAEQQQYLGQLNTKLTTLKKTFPGGKPEAAVKRVTEMIQPWNDTLEQRARQFTIRDFKKIDPLPQTDLLKAYYAQTAQKMHDELLTELAVKGVYYNPAIDFYFQMAQPSAVQGRAVNAMQVTYWLAMMKMGDSITRMLIDSEILGIDNLSLWAPHPEGEGFVSYAVGASMWMTMDQFCKLLEKLQSDETMCITVQGFRIGNTALRAYVDPPLRIELVFTIDQYKYEPGAPVGAGPAGGAANNEMMAAMKAKKSTLSITEKPASKSWWSSLIPW